MHYFRFGQPEPHHPPFFKKVYSDRLSAARQSFILKGKGIDDRCMIFIVNFSSSPVDNRFVLAIYPQSMFGFGSDKIPNDLNMLIHNP